MSKTITEQFKEELGIKNFVLKGLVGMQVAEALLDYRSLEMKINMMRQGLDGQLLEAMNNMDPEVRSTIMGQTMEYQRIVKAAEKLKDSAQKKKLLEEAEELQQKINQVGMESVNLADHIAYKPAQEDLMNQAKQAKISQFDFIISNLSAALKEEITGLDELSPGQYNEIINQLIQEPQNDLNTTNRFFG